MLRFLVEISVALGLSLLVLTSFGVERYAVIGGTIAVVGALLIYSTHGLFRNVENAPTLLWLLLTLCLCLLLGMVWPALPVIFFYERGKTKRYRAKHAKPIAVVAGNAVDDGQKPL